MGSISETRRGVSTRCWRFFDLHRLFRTPWRLLTRRFPVTRQMHTAGQSFPFFERQVLQKMEPIEGTNGCRCGLRNVTEKLELGWGRAHQNNLSALPKKLLQFVPGFRNAPHRPVVTANPSVYVLDEDWSQNCLTPEEFKQSWLWCHDPDAMWPHDVQLLQGKLYKGGKLCVPEDRVEAMLLAYHVGSGHPGQKRLLVASRT